MIFLDTHIVVWLYAGDVDRFPQRTRRMLESEHLLISPMVLLELQYLHELSRIKQGPAMIVKELEKSLGLTIHTEDFERVVSSGDASPDEKAGAHLWLGKIFDSKKERAKAVEQYDLVLKLDCDPGLKEEAQRYKRRAYGQ